MMIVLYFLWPYFVCSYYVAPRENFKANEWERMITGGKAGLNPKALTPDSMGTPPRP